MTETAWAGPRPAGSLDGALDPPAGDTGGAEQLIAAVVSARDAHGSIHTLTRRLREATLWVETTRGQRLPVPVGAQGLAWLPVHTSLQRLAWFAQVSGRAGTPVHYGTLTGDELLDCCWPALPAGTGLVLDPVCNHVMALPAPPQGGAGRAAH